MLRNTDIRSLIAALPEKYRFDRELDGELFDDLLAAAQEVFDGTLFIRWGYKDVIWECAGHGRHITEEQARDVLYQVDRWHDASIGVNWDVIYTIATETYDLPTITEDEKEAIFESMF